MDAFNNTGQDIWYNKGITFSVLLFSCCYCCCCSSSSLPCFSPFFFYSPKVLIPLLSSPVCLSSLPFLSELHLAHTHPFSPSGSDSVLSEHWFSKELSKLSRPGRSALARHKLWTLLRRCFWKEDAKKKTDDTPQTLYICMCFACSFDFVCIICVTDASFSLSINYLWNTIRKRLWKKPCYKFPELLLIDI